MKEHNSEQPYEGNGDSGVNKYKSELETYLLGQKEGQKNLIVASARQDINTFKEEIQEAKNHSDISKENQDTKETLEDFFYENPYDKMEHVDTSLVLYNDLIDYMDTQGIFERFGINIEIPTASFETDQFIIDYIKKQYGEKSKEVSTIYNYVGRTFTIESNYREAEKYLSYAQEIQEKEIPDTLALADTYTNIGDLYADYNAKVPELFIKYYKKAFAIFDSKGNQFSKKPMVNEGVISFIKERKEYVVDKMIELNHIDEAMEYIEKMGYDFGRAEVYRKQYRFDEAIQIYDKILAEYTWKDEYVQSIRTITLADKAIFQRDEIDQKTLKRYLKDAIDTLDKLQWSKSATKQYDKEGKEEFYDSLISDSEREKQSEEKQKRTERIRQIKQIKQKSEEFKEIYERIDSIEMRLTNLENQFNNFLTNELPQIKSEIKDRLSEKRFTHLETQVKSLVNTVVDMKQAIKQGKDIDEVKIKMLENIFSNPNLRDYYTTTQSIINALYTGKQSLSTGLFTENIPKTIENTLSLSSYLPIIGKVLRKLKQVGINGSSIDNIRAMGNNIDAKVLIQNIESQTLMNTLSEKISTKLVEIRKKQISSFSREKKDLGDHITQEFNSYAKFVNIKSTIRDTMIHYLSGISDTQVEIEALSDMASATAFLSKVPENDQKEKENIKNIYSDKGIYKYRGEKEVNREDYLANQVILYTCGKNIEKYFRKEEVEHIQKNSNNDSILQKFMQEQLSIHSTNGKVQQVYLAQFKKGLVRNTFIN